MFAFYREWYSRERWWQITQLSKENAKTFAREGAIRGCSLRNFLDIVTEQRKKS